MNNLKKWYIRYPFWEGVATTFDLFGLSGLSSEDIKSLNSKRLKNNTIMHDFSIVFDDMGKAINQYGREIKTNR